MRISDIKIGESYYYWDEEWTAEIIEKADQNAGIWQSGVICRCKSTGDRRKITARMLMPWEEHLAQEKLYSDAAAETGRHIKRFADAIGEGADYDREIEHIGVEVKFTEKAAQRLLELCDAQPLPEDKKPSKAPDEETFVERCNNLSQRLRRALGVGHAGRGAGYSLLRANATHHARLYFYDDQAKQAADKLLGAEPEQSSALAELIN